MKNNLIIKAGLYNLCETFIQSRLKNVQHNIAEVQMSLTSETKSSAGDKHETGRAMLQLEREKFGAQLAEINQVKKNMSKVNINGSSKIVCLGSVVFTNQSNYFIAISAGQLNFKETNYYGIAPNTPIGLLLMGKQAGDAVTFRDREFKIIEVI